jgi:hypothetical protein
VKDEEGKRIKELFSVKIPRLETLPDAARRSTWARLLEMDQATFYRAERAGKLQSAKPGARTVLYTRKAILAWLGLEELSPVVAATVGKNDLAVSSRRIKSASRK